MNQSEILQLLELAEEKIRLLEQYGELTDSICKADIDTAESLIEKRQGIISRVDELTAEIKLIVNKQELLVKQQLEMMFSFQPVTSAGIFETLAERLDRMKNIFVSLAEKEKAGAAHLAQLKGELVEKMQRSNQDRKVMDFVNSTSSAEIFRGKELDEKS